MIIFKKIKFKNFLSVGNIFTEVDLNSHGFSLIDGINGSGKSTILDALTYVLFNKSYRDINKPQLINSITKGNLVVEIEFSIGNVNYLIRRGMSPIIFEIFQNEQLLNQAADARDYQQYLEKTILKTNYKSFCQVVVLGFATYEFFMRLVAAQKRHIIEDFLDLEIFTIMNNRLKEKIITNSERLNDLSLEKIRLLSKVKLLQEHIDYVNTNNEETKRDYEELNKDIEKKIDNTKIQLETDRILADILSEKVKGEIGLKNKLEKLISYKHKMTEDLKRLNRENIFFEKHDSCPICFQDIHKNFKAQLHEERKLEIDTVEIGLNLLFDKIIEVNDELSKIKGIKSEITQLKLNIQYSNMGITSLIQQMNNNIENIKKLSKKDETVVENIDETKRLLEQCKKEYQEYEEQKILYNSIGFILKDNGIKSQIIKRYIPIINKFINKFLSELEFFGTFELDENFKETIKSRYRDTFSYNSFSQGERFRIDIALLFTWREVAKYRNSIATNLLIMDELFDGPLDQDGMDSLFKFFGSLKNTNVFIITPKGDAIAEKFDRVITFSKNRNFSYIER